MQQKSIQPGFYYGSHDDADPRHTTGRKKGSAPGMNTEDIKSLLDPEGTAVLY